MEPKRHPVKGETRPYHQKRCSAPESALATPSSRTPALGPLPKSTTLLDPAPGPVTRPRCHYPFPPGSLPQPTLEPALCSGAPPSADQVGRPRLSDPLPPRPGGRSRLRVRQPGVPQPALAAGDCSCLRIRASFFGVPEARGVYRKALVGQGKALDPLQSFRIRLSLQWEAPCDRAGPAVKPSLEAAQTPAVC